PRHADLPSRGHPHEGRPYEHAGVARDARPLARSRPRRIRRQPSGAPQAARRRDEIRAQARRRRRAAPAGVASGEDGVRRAAAPLVSRRERRRDPRSPARRRHARSQRPRHAVGGPDPRRAPVGPARSLGSDLVAGVPGAVVADVGEGRAVPSRARAPHADGGGALMSHRPLRIVHVVPTLDVGGLENGLVNLVAALPELTHAVVSMGPLGAFARRLPRAVELSSLAKPAGAPMRLAMFRLLRVLRRLQPDLVHSRNWGAIEAVPAARLAGVRAVVHSEHGRELSDPEGLNARRNRFRRLLAPLMDRVVTVSADLSAWLQQTGRLPAGKLLVIPNGVDTRRFSPARRFAGRQALRAADQTMVIGTVGRLNGIKDYPTLLTAFADIARRAPHVTL